MKRRILLSVAMLSVLLLSVTDAAKRAVFHPPVPEEQTVAWLKERNHDAEALGAGLYRIYWRDYSGGPLRDERGDSYSVRAFDWGPRGGKADVFVSSRVEWVEPAHRTTPDTGLPEYRYIYSITSRETSQHPVHTLWVRTLDLPRSWLRDISNPPGWKNFGQPPEFAGASNHVAWNRKFGTPYILPGTSQGGFAFKCRSVPGIITAEVWTSGGSIDGHEAVVTPYHHQYAPRGFVIGPEAIPVGTSASELTRRLETLISRSVTLGWLDEDAAVPLRQHLANSVTAFGKHELSEARREIQAFVATLDVLEKQRGTVPQRTGEPNSPSGEGEQQVPAEPPLLEEALTLQLREIGFKIQEQAEPPLLEEALTLLQTNAAYLLTKF